jgi:hypothetical protein
MSQLGVTVSKSWCALLNTVFMRLLRPHRATHLNYTLAKLLRDLSLRVNSEDKQKIEHALNDVRLFLSNS